MKKLLLIITILTAVASYGQFTKGTRTVGINIANMNFSANNSSFDPESGGSSSSTTNNLNFSISPSMGWFMSEKLLVGGLINLNFFNSKYDAGRNNNAKNNDVTFGLGVFGRYYLGAGGFMPFLQASAGAGFGSGKETGLSTITVPGGTEKYTTERKGILNLNAGIGGGLTKMVNKNVGFDLGLNYNFISSSYNYSRVGEIQYPASSERRESKGKFSNFNNNVGVSIGMLIFLDPKTKN